MDLEKIAEEAKIREATQYAKGFCESGQYEYAMGYIEQLGDMRDERVDELRSEIVMGLVETDQIKKGVTIHLQAFGEEQTQAVFEQYLETKLEDGRYGHVSEVVDIVKQVFETYKK